MRTLGLDVGDVRTGVAVSDAEGIMAFPLTMIANKSEDATIEDIIRLVEQHGIECIVVGLPRSLNGSLNRQADKITVFTEKLRNAIAAKAEPAHLANIGIKMWDEWFSTIAAEKLMVQARTKRNARNEHRDAMAAAFILQGFLDSSHSRQGEEYG